MTRRDSLSCTARAAQGAPAPAARKLISRRFTATALLASATVAFGTLAGVTAPAQAVAQEFVTNGGFETSTAGWAANVMPGGRGASLTRVAGGHEGAYSARIQARYSGLATLNDSPDDTVASTKAFQAYTATAYVRTTTPGVSVEIRVQELDGGIVGTGGSGITLNDTNWHELSTVYTASRTGSSMNLRVISYAMPAGKSFDVDSISLTAATPVVDTTQWARAYRNDFATMTDVNASTSGKTENSALLPTDVSNGALQKPTVRSNVVVTADAAASDGKALGVFTRQAAYSTNSGTKVGWANGRMSIGGQNQAPPVRVTARMKFTASAKAKAAVMWWPAGGGWPWEVDMAETFGGNTTTDYWGARQHVGQRWHSDIDGDGSATEQLIHDDALDATTYHVYDLIIQKDYMSMTIDGVKTFETRDTNFLPDSPGFFAVGKALTHTRGAAGRTNDAVFVDWVEISKPAL